MSVLYLRQDGEDVEPVLKLTHSCGEGVSSAEGGVVGNQVTKQRRRLVFAALRILRVKKKVFTHFFQGYEEIVVATYTGKVRHFIKLKYLSLCFKKSFNKVSYIVIYLFFF
jgi:hypothetical protein